MRKIFRDIICITVMAGTMLGTGLLSGCTLPFTQQTKETIDPGIGYVDPNENIDEYDSNFNHGYQLRNYEETDAEISRSWDALIRDSNDALVYMKEYLNLRGGGFSVVLVDTTANDPGVLMTYTYEIYYDGVKMICPDFKLIAFVKGAVIEGPFYPLSLNMERKNANAKPNSTLAHYCNTYEDKRIYSYEGAYYLYRDTNKISCPYVFVYRYIGDSPVDNMTLMLDANTGAFVSLEPDTQT